MTESEFPRTHNKPPLSEYLPEQYGPLFNEMDEIADKANKFPKKVTNEEELGNVADLVKSVKALAKKADTARVEEKRPHLEAGRTIDNFFSEITDRTARIEKVFTGIASDYQREKLAAERRAAEEEARKLREEAERKRREAEEATRSATAARKTDEAEILDEKAEDAAAQAEKSAADLDKFRTASGTKVSAKSEWDFKITDYSAIPLDKLRMQIPRSEVEAALKKYVKENQDNAPLPGVTFFESVKAKFR